MYNHYVEFILTLYNYLNIFDYLIILENIMTNNEINKCIFSILIYVYAFL